MHRNVLLLAALVGAIGPPVDAEPIPGLAEHRARSGHAVVYGTLNVAFGPALLDATEPVTIGFDRSRPRVHTVNVSARLAAPVYVSVDPRTTSRVDFFGVAYERPGAVARPEAAQFGTITIKTLFPPENVYQRIEAGQIRVLHRPSEQIPAFRRPQADAGALNWRQHNAFFEKAQRVWERRPLINGVRSQCGPGKKNLWIGE